MGILCSKGFNAGMIHSTIGYHGTSANHGNKIIQEQRINPSTKQTEWLGNGIYYWAYRSDAVWWGRLESQKAQNSGCAPVVLTSELSVAYEHFLDLDDSEQYTNFCNEADEFLKSANGLAFKNIYELRCFISNYYAAAHNIELLAYTFSRNNQTGSGFDRLNRRQYCVKDPKVIQSIKMEVDDYAV